MKKVTRIIDNNTLFFEYELCDGEYLDTKVTLNGSLLCWISFPDLEAFVDEFAEFMSKYRI